MTIAAPLREGRAGAEPARPPRRIVCAGVLAGAAVLGIVAHLLGLITGSWTRAVIDQGAFSAVAALAGWSVLTRARGAGDQRTAWTLLGCALWLTAIANALWVTVFASAAVSPADALFLSAYVLVFASLVLLAFSWALPAPRSLWLDGAVAVLALASVGVALLIPGIVTRGHAPLLEALVQTAYPVGDLATMAFVVLLLTLVGGRPQPSLVLIGGGLILQSIADSSYVWELTGGHLQLVAKLAEGLWSAGWLALGAAPWLPDRRSRGLRMSSWAVFATPSIALFAATGVLAVDRFEHVPTIAVALALATVVASMARGLATFRDLRTLAEARRLSRIDELTGLTNRRGFLARMERCLQDGCEHAAVLVLDLDRFKELNDTLGHHSGDLLLAELGPRLAGAVRSHDVLARLGGDEFAVLCPEMDERGAVAVGERLQAAVQRPFRIAGLAVSIDASIGIALAPDHARSAEGLLQRADVAMYEAKANRSAIEVYDRARDVYSRERLALVAQLRDALSRDGEVVLHYQPQLNLLTGEAEGVEALVRWRHPQLGLLTPASFLAAANGAGMTRRLSAHVLRVAIAQAASWHRAGKDLPVAVNLSATDLADPSLAGEVARLLLAHGLPSDMLRLELTETDYMRQPERARQTLAELRELGCLLALDDFGTGHSSLSLLKALPLDEIKIDRSFVSGVAVSPTDAAIVRATVALGRELGLRVVAEGVESEEMWHALRGLGATTAQGYLISPPLSARKLSLWLRGPLRAPRAPAPR